MAPIQKVRQRKINFAKKAKQTNSLDNRQPPDDFRDIIIYPSIEDIYITKIPFLRANISKGCYSDVDHYLDVQFRLLREDFLSPLREGLTNYCDKLEKANCDFRNDLMESKDHNIRLKMYKGVVFLDVVLVHDHILSLLVKLDYNQINTDNTDKLFMHGSLLFFSQDNFKSVIWATVSDSLDEGKIKVRLANDEDLVHIVFNRHYMMGESEAFFEPYKNVLDALQTMDMEDFPMCDYITGNRSTTKAPKYLSSQPCQHFDSAKSLNLNETQYEAYKMALTSDLALIQGPPGTGKTYLGFRIVEALLSGGDQATKPLLIVCATNHALDQFLEGILKFNNSIVRVGNQSKSEDLQPYLLRNRRRYYRDLKNSNKAEFTRINGRMYAIFKNIQQHMSDTNKLVCHEGIVSQRSLSNILGTDALTFRDGLIADKRFLAWLQVQSPSTNNDGLESPGNSRISHIFDLEVVDKMIKNNHTQIKILNQELSKKNQTSESKNIASALINNLEKSCASLTSKKMYVIRKIEDDDKQIIEKEAAEYLMQDDAWSIPLGSRWKLYHYWVSKCCSKFQDLILDLYPKFDIQALKYENIKREQDLTIMSNADIVGMTTSCAARLRPLLENLQPKILIVEEAAEVLESHIVSSLTRHCEHLILIGDHQQLRPKTSSFKLNRDYKLDVSLFERLVTNGVPYVTLNVQHRMRPEIAQLISPAIYPWLCNHKSTVNRSNTNGMVKNLYFLNHSEPELGANKSYKNHHEALMLLSLARYLILQGNNPNKITIITMYSAQIAFLENESREYNLNTLQIKTVDGYQGEENDIVLLSLVRSNSSATIGFLKTINRVCVALSRARAALYIVGNMDNLTRDRRSIWCSINNVLKKQNAVGPHFTLCCEKHNCSIEVEKPTDFNFDLVEKTGCPLNCKVKQFSKNNLADGQLKDNQAKQSNKMQIQTNGTLSEFSNLSPLMDNLYINGKFPDNKNMHNDHIKSEMKAKPSSFNMGANVIKRRYSKTESDRNHIFSPDFNNVPASFHKSLANSSEGTNCVVHRKESPPATTVFSEHDTFRSPHSAAKPVQQVPPLKLTTSPKSNHLESFSYSSRQSLGQISPTENAVPIRPARIHELPPAPKVTNQAPLHSKLNSQPLITFVSVDDFFDKPSIPAGISLHQAAQNRSGTTASRPPSSSVVLSVPSSASCSQTNQHVLGAIPKTGLNYAYTNGTPVVGESSTTRWNGPASVDRYRPALASPAVRDAELMIGYHRRQVPPVYKAKEKKKDCIIL